MEHLLALLTVIAALAAAGGLDAQPGAEGVFPAGQGLRYRLLTTVLLNEAGSRGKDVGFQVAAELSVAVVWQEGPERIIKLQVIKPQLHIKSRKAPAPDGFVEHASKLESMNNNAFYIHWNNGKIEYIYVEEGEDLSVVNFKKGIASLFQFQVLDVEVTEKDASGKCLAKYTTINSHSFLKTKSECVSGKNVPYIAHPDKILGVIVKSQRSVKYTMTKDLSAIDSIAASETHELIVALRQEAGSSIQATFELFLTGTSEKVEITKANTAETALTEIQRNNQKDFSKQILITEREPRICQDDCPSLSKLVKENKKFLKNEYLGTIKSATAFIKLLNIVRESKKEDIFKVLKSTKNDEVMLHLLDLLGAAQTLPAHEAAIKYLQLRDDSRLDENERYFWALSLGSHPHPQVVKGVLKLSYETNPSEKLEETIVLTAAALANRLSKLPGNNKHKVVEETKQSLLDGLNGCQSEECKQKYLRGLRNLGHGDSVPALLKYATTGSRKTSVTAMKALRSLAPQNWNETVLAAMKRIYFQLDQKYDSSARTLALDVLLESNPSRDLLKELLLSLASRDPVYEVKQYMWQRLMQISEKDPKLKSTIYDIIKEENKILNNYHIMAIRGLSTAFTRSFFSNPSGNGSLETVQEISSGLLKRGTVDVVLDSYGDKRELFSLGLFAGGLGSLISSDEGENDEAATAGMEITALGVTLRPFIFFNGQGELMGHVWSGTGSEKTPAFQVLTLLHDHLEFLPLQTGFIAELSLLGGVSFDLSGQIQLSLWNRNAHSLVEKNAGLVLQGRMRVDTAFVRSESDFSLATEVSLKLSSDIDFYSNIALCLQLQQPDSVIKHNIYKVERIPGSKHRLRKSKYKVIPVSGRTFALNRKNNEMCNVISGK